MPNLSAELAAAVIGGDAKKAVELTKAGLAQGLPASDLFRQGLIAGMTTVGEKMQQGEYYIPEVLLSARAMRQATEVLKPILAEGSGFQATGKVVLGTVWGDLHDIGKNLVLMMLEGAGYQVTDLGTNVMPERFVAAIKENQAQLVGLSALLTTTMLNMRGVMAALREAGVRDQVKVMVGGAPVDQRFADEIGADGYAPDAASAATLAKRLQGS